MKRWLVIWLLAFAAVARAEPVELATARTVFLTALDKIATERVSRFQGLQADYLKGLEQFRKTQMAAGNLDGVVAVKAEIDRVMNWVNPDYDQKQGMPAGLQTLRRQYDAGVARIVADGLAQELPLRQGYARDLETLQRKFTQTDQIDAAVAVKLERDGILAGLSATPAPVVPEPPTTITPPTVVPIPSPTLPVTGVPPNLGPQKKLVIRTLIDGSDNLVIRGTRIWFEHRSGANPGMGNGERDPTLINGVKWQPVWHNRESMPYDRLMPPLPSMPLPQMQLNQIAGRGTVTIVERPSRDNVYVFRVLIEDDEHGADWYELEITW